MFLISCKTRKGELNIGTFICSEHSSDSNNQSSGAWCLPWTLPIDLFSVEEKAGHNTFQPIFAWWNAMTCDISHLICWYTLDLFRTEYAIYLMFYVLQFQANREARRQESRKTRWGSKLSNQCAHTSLRQSGYWAVTKALQHRCPISLEEFIKMAGWRRQRRPRRSCYHASDAAPKL